MNTTDFNTAADFVKGINAARAALNMPAITGKGESKAKLAEQLTRLQAELAAKKPAKSTGWAVKKKSGEKKERAEGTFALADLAREMDIEPKVARAKARRNKQLAALAVGDGWSFRDADKERVVTLLTTDDRKKK